MSAYDPGCSGTRTRSESRLLFYSHDGFGLGHLRRNLKLASRLTADLPGASAVLLAGYPGTPGLDLPRGVDLIKLPSIRKVATGQWEPRQLHLPLPQLQEIRRAVIRQVFDSFAPDLVVIDYLPLGIWGELAEPLRWLRRERPTARAVLGLRDVLDSPLVTRRSWLAEGHDAAVGELYDEVLIYGDRDVIDTARVYGIEELAPGRVAYTGYVCGESVAAERAAHRPALGLAPDEALILVTAGGGADAFPMMRAAVEATRELVRGGLRARMLVVTGPLMSEDERSHLRSIAIGLPVIVERWRSRLEATMAAADVVVTMAAYNTLTEAVRLCRQVVSIPRAGPSAEQTTRAALFAERGLATALPPDAKPAEVGRAIARCLTSPRAVIRPPAMNGLDTASARLRVLLEQASGSPQLGRASPGGRLA